MTSEQQDDDFPSDEEMEQWLEEWDEADREAVALLGSALGHERGAPPPPGLAAAAASVRTAFAEGGRSLAWVGRAAAIAFEQLPDDDAELLLKLTSASISPSEDTGLGAEEEALLLSLEHGDWLGAIITAVRAGPGSDASPEALVEGIDQCPELEFEGELDIDDASHIEAAFWIVAVPWELLGLLDRDQRLTDVGAWVLPRALARAWEGDFDRDPAG